MKYQLTRGVTFAHKQNFDKDFYKKVFDLETKGDIPGFDRTIGAGLLWHGITSPQDDGCGFTPLNSLNGLADGIEMLREWLCKERLDEGGTMYIAFRDVDNGASEEIVVELIVFSDTVVINTGRSAFLYRGKPDLTEVAGFAVRCRARARAQVPSGVPGSSTIDEVGLKNTAQTGRIQAGIPNVSNVPKIDLEKRAVARAVQKDWLEEALLLGTPYTPDRIIEAFKQTDLYLDAHFPRGSLEIVRSLLTDEEQEYLDVSSLGDAHLRAGRENEVETQPGITLYRLRDVLEKYQELSAKLGTYPNSASVRIRGHVGAALIEQGVVGLSVYFGHFEIGVFQDHYVLSHGGIHPWGAISRFDGFFSIYDIMNACVRAKYSFLKEVLKEYQESWKTT